MGATGANVGTDHFLSDCLIDLMIYIGPFQQLPPERPKNGVDLRRVIALIAAVVIWSGLMLIVYLATDGTLSWLAANASSVADNAEKLAAATGVGKEAETVIDSLNTGSVLEQVVAAVELIAKPIFMAIWLVGTLFILIAPIFLRRLISLIRR